MPRRARLLPPGLPLHIVHRGHNRAPCFATGADRLRYLDLLAESCANTGCRIHAFVLMTNHVHLLVTAGECHGVSRMMKHVAQHHAQFMNWKRKASGSLWEGRFHSSPVQSDAYLFACHRYIELNPVRAGLVRHPRDHPWSSYRCNAEAMASPIVTPHAEYLALGGDDKARAAAYRALFAEEFDSRVEEQIRDSSRGGFALGTPAFHDHLEALLGTTTRRGIRGRRKATGIK